MLGQRPLQSGQSQNVIQAATQVPSANATGEDVHDHGQVDKVMAEANVGDVRYPYLFGPHDLQVLDQVRIAGKVVLTVGCAAVSALGLGLDVHQPHQTLHPSVVHEPFLAPQLRGDATIAVGRPLSGHGLDGPPESHLIRRLRGLVVVAAPDTIKGIARQ
jgi:hypothetical protein